MSHQNPENIPPPENNDNNAETGAVVGMVGGAGLGVLFGGPIGAVVGGAIGGVIGGVFGYNVAK